MVANKCILPLCLAVLLLCSASPASASEFRVYCGRLPPVNYIEKGKARGIAVDMVKELMQRAGYPLDNSDFLCVDWRDSMAEVARSPKAMLVSAALTPEREYSYKWVGPVAWAQIGLIGLKSANITVNTPADLAHYRVAVIRGSAPISMLRAFCAGGSDCSEKSIVVVDSFEDQFRLLKQGDVALIGHSDISALSMMPDFGLDPGQYEMVHVLSLVNLYVLLNKNTDDALVTAMQKALDEIPYPTVKAIHRRYLGAGKLSVRKPVQ